MRSRFVCLAALSTVSARIGWRDPDGFENGRDLEHFVTRPEIKAPRYMVAKHVPEAITPGYWFVTPYSNFFGEPDTARREHIPCQTGPHIYDGNGTLVWSGACQFSNRNSFNLKPYWVNGEPHLSFFVSGMGSAPKEHPDKEGAGILLNNAYEEVGRVRPQNRKTDVHELTILDNGQTAMLSAIWQETVDASDVGQKERYITGNGFQRIADIHKENGRLAFDWDAYEQNITISESHNIIDVQDEKHGELDYFHLNSVDENDDGDYLISARHACTLYKISGKDGHVMWRLGGYNSSFVMDDDVPFKWQHHAHWISSNETHSIVSVFDNGCEESNRDHSFHAYPAIAKIIILDTSATPMTAKILRSFQRPDGGLTPLQGSVQKMSDDVYNSNIFVDWAMSGYLSEYDANNNMVMEARFISDRFRTYRAYKFPFVGKPKEKPVCKILPTAYGRDEVATTIYVSWNGATEVASWVYHGSATERGPFHILGSTQKQGFETSWMTREKVNFVFAQAFDAAGIVLGASDVAALEPVPDVKQPQYQLIAPSLVITPAAQSWTGEEEDEWSEPTVTLQPAALPSPDEWEQYDLTTIAWSILAMYGFFCAARTLFSEIRKFRLASKLSHIELSA